MKYLGREGIVAAALLASTALSSATMAATIDWTTVVNNGDSMPGSTAKFNSYNQPSINNALQGRFSRPQQGPIAADPRDLQRQRVQPCKYARAAHGGG